jgi:hypothetical protein
MNSVALFGIQFVWFLIVWTTIAELFVKPLVQRSAINDQLSIWLLPQLFRILGVGLLVQNLAPDLPYSFALPTAIGDAITAVFAFVSIIALQKKWSSARSLVFVCNVIGSVDLLIALPHAAVTQAPNYLAAQWYVPAVVVPFMIVSHVMLWRTLLSDRPE